MLLSTKWIGSVLRNFALALLSTVITALILWYTRIPHETKPRIARISISHLLPRLSIHNHTILIFPL